MTVLQKVTQGASQRTPLLWTFNPFHWELSVRSSISGIFMLFTPTYRALVTVCTICHWPCKDACRTELVVIITLLWISHHKVAERVTFNFKLVESGLQCAVRIDRNRHKVSLTDLPIIWIGHWIWVGMYVVHKMISVLFAIKLTQNFRLSLVVKIFEYHICIHADMICFHIYTDETYHMLHCHRSLSFSERSRNSSSGKPPTFIPCGLRIVSTTFWNDISWISPMLILKSSIWHAA